MQLYGSAEERYARLKENTRKLAETIRNLGARHPVSTRPRRRSSSTWRPSQIQAIGRAADSSVVMLEMKRSLDVMTESINVTTQFVSDTQLFFRSNLDTLINDLNTFDESTSALLDENLKVSKDIEQQRIERAIAKAQSKGEPRGESTSAAT